MAKKGKKTTHPVVAIATAYLRGSLGISNWAMVSYGAATLIAGYRTNKISADEKSKLSSVPIAKKLLDTPAYAFQDYSKHLKSAELIYSTAQFDSLITDLTKFCCFKWPEKFLKQVNISIVEVKKDTKENIINAAVRRKVREIGSRSTFERLGRLEEAIERKFDLSEKERTGLSDIAEIRNASLHDRTFFDIEFRNNSIKTVMRNSKKSIDELGEYQDSILAKISAKILTAFLDRIKSDLDSAERRVLASAINTLEGMEDTVERHIQNTAVPKQNHQ